MQHKCPYCNKVLTSVNKYNLHLALDHEAYRNAEQVNIATIRSLKNDREKVLFLLRRFPACRKTNNGALFLKFSQYFLGMIVYDTGMKLYALKGDTPEIPKNYKAHTPLELAFAQLEGARRARQKLQEYDKENYHDKAGNTIKEHVCVLPTAEDSFLAMVREREMRMAMAVH